MLRSTISLSALGATGVRQRPMSHTRWTPIAARARHSFGQRRTSGASYPTRLDLIQANQVTIMRALGALLGDPHSSSELLDRLRNHANRTQAHLDAKLNAPLANQPWRPADAKVGGQPTMANTGETFQNGRGYPPPPRNPTSDIP